MVALNFDLDAFVEQQWRDRETLSPDVLYSHVFWRRPGWQDFAETLYRRLHGHYAWNDPGQRWDISHDVIRLSLCQEYRHTMNANNTGIHLFEWLDDLFHRAWAKLLDIDQVPHPGLPSSDSFNVIGWLITAIRNLANSDLHERARTLRVRTPQVKFDEAWTLYVLASGGIAAIEAWWNKPTKFKKYKPHPWLEFAKNHFLETGSRRYLEHVVSLALRAGGLRAKCYRFKVGEAEMASWGQSDLLVQDEIDRRILGKSISRRDACAASALLYPDMADDVCRFTRLQASLAEQSHQERDTLKAYYIDGLDDPGAAAMLGIKPNTYSKRRQRALDAVFASYRKRRYPRHKDFLLLANLGPHEFRAYLDQLSPREFHRFLHSHTDDQSPAEIDGNQFEAYVAARSLLSKREPDAVFTDPLAPWDTTRSPLHVPPADTEPRRPYVEHGYPRIVLLTDFGGPVIEPDLRGLIDVQLPRGVYRRRPDCRVLVKNRDRDLVKATREHDAAVLRRKAARKLVGYMKAQAKKSRAISPPAPPQPAKLPPQERKKLRLDAPASPKAHGPHKAPSRPTHRLWFNRGGWRVPSVPMLAIDRAGALDDSGIGSLVPR